jgi:aryl-alcohol dehydrogenase-like predicted oxidoreductase
MHHVDRATPWEEIWQAMETLVQQGKVIYVGSSNFAGWHIAQANEIARSRHALGLVSEQCKYNLTQRMAEIEVLPACERYGLGVIPYSPLAAGLLSGSSRRGGAERVRRESEWSKKDREKHAAALERYQAFCRELGKEPADVALAWLLSRPVVTAPIIGPRTLEQLDTALGSLEVRLDEGTLSRLDEIFPGYKTSPEVFAW